MAIYSVEDTMRRISSAPEDSPIIVFRVPGGVALRSAFGTTVRSAIEAERYNEDFVGVFSRVDQRDLVLSELRKAAPNHEQWSSKRGKNGQRPLSMGDLTKVGIMDDLPELPSRAQRLVGQVAEDSA